jgi:4-alpha-glucanotransferase
MGDRCWLLAVQLYSLQTPGNLGHGDFGDLAKLLPLVAAAGGDGIGLNPLHALFEDRPEEASPYAPNSRHFLNPLYLDLAMVPGTEDRKVPPGDGLLIDYAQVAAQKYAALRDAHRRFRASPSVDLSDEFDAYDLSDEFDAYREQAGTDLRRFALFIVLRRHHGAHWREWPMLWRDVDSAALDRLAVDEADEVDFQEFLQWQAHRQLAACRDLAQRLGMRIGLYLDLAVGVHPDGFDAWNGQGIFLKDISIGAPPDPLNQAGQNWGLTAFNPMALERHAYEPFRRMLAATMQYAGAIRFDHILGLNRLYLIPTGRTGRDGAYVTLPLAGLIAVIVAESHEYRCLVIGEDLGTVPDGLRETLRDAGIWTFLVTQFARDAHGDFLAPSSYTKQGLATFGTHDLPTLTGWLAASDLAVLAELNIPPGETAAQREMSRRALIAALDREKIAPGDAFERIAGFLARTPSGVVSIALEDVLGIVPQVNLPGTNREYPNWRRRLPIAFDHLAGKLATLGRILAAEGRGRQPIK